MRSHAERGNDKRDMEAELDIQMSHLDSPGAHGAPSRSLDFYSRVLGMRQLWCLARACPGVRRVNLHQLGAEFEPKATYPQPGLCFIVHDRLEAVIEHLYAQGVDILEGPGDAHRVRRSKNPLSVYLFDPEPTSSNFPIPWRPRHERAHSSAH